MTAKRLLLFMMALVLGVLLLSGLPPATLSAEPDLPEDIAIDQQQEDDEDSEEDSEPGELEEEKVPEVVETVVTEEKMSPKQMRELEEKLQILKDQIFKSRARLKQLRDELYLSSVSVVNAAIFHTQNHGGTFRLLSLRYTLDGFEIFAELNEDKTLNDMENYIMYEGSLLPGDHLLVVDLYYQGRGYGVFSYLNDYTYHVKSRYSFMVDEGDTFNLYVTAVDEGAFLGSLKDRLKVKFVKETREE